MADPIRTAIVEIVRAEIAARANAAPAWSWVSCTALSLSSRAALRLARKESIRTTRISGRVFLHRADLDALAARGSITIAPHEAIESADDAAADLDRLATFRRRGRR